MAAPMTLQGRVDIQVTQARDVKGNRIVGLVITTAGEGMSTRLAFLMPQAQAEQVAEAVKGAASPVDVQRAFNGTVEVQP